MTNEQVLSDRERDWTGFVLDTREANGYNDSDFFATVWDEKTQSVREIEDGTTRFAAPSRYHKADASPEIVAKAKAWLVETYLPPLIKSKLQREAAKVQKDNVVVVVRGRKVPVGTSGVVKWVGRDAFQRPSRYGNALGIHLFNEREWRVGIKVAGQDKLIYTSMANVELEAVRVVFESEARAAASKMNPSFSGVFHPSFTLGLLF